MIKKKHNIYLINLIVILLLLILIEIFSRIFLFFYLGNATAGMKERQANLQYEPFVMYGPEWQNNFSDIKINSDQYRVILLGGSTAQLFPEKIITDHLQKSGINKKILIFNLAYGGYIAKQELINLSLWSNKIQPHLIINLDGANDIIHSLKQKKVGEFLLNDTYDLYLTKPLLSPFIWILQKSQFYNSLKRM